MSLPTFSYTRWNWKENQRNQKQIRKSRKKFAFNRKINPKKTPQKEVIRTLKGKYGEVLYQGQMLENQRHGTGVSYRSNGSVEFDGKWKFDICVEGDYYDRQNRLEYSGSFDSSNRPDGNGTFYFSDKTRYVGEFKNGLFHGKGKRITEKGEIIVSGSYILGRLVYGTTQHSLSAGDSIIVTPISPSLEIRKSISPSSSLTPSPSASLTSSQSSCGSYISQPIKDHQHQHQQDLLEIKSVLVDLISQVETQEQIISSDDAPVSLNIEGKENFHHENVIEEEDCSDEKTDDYYEKRIISDHDIVKVRKLQHIAKSFLLRINEKRLIQDKLIELKQRRDHHYSHDNLNRRMNQNYDSDEQATLFSYVGPYSRGGGLPHGDVGTFRFHDSTTYIGGVVKNRMHGQGQMTFSKVDRGRKGNDTSRSIVAKGLFEEGDPRDIFSHVSFGSLSYVSEKSENFNQKPFYYGRSVHGEPSGLGIQIIENKKVKKRKKTCGRWWFGRSCGCTNLHGVELNEEQEKDIFRYSMESTFPSFRSSTLEYKQHGISLTDPLTDSLSTEINRNDHSNDSQKISILSKYVKLKDGTSYCGSIFNGEKPIGIGTLVVGRGQHQTNPLARVYDGHFNERGEPIYGETRWENGDVYSGEHDAFGRPHGVGKIIYGGCEHFNLLPVTTTAATTTPLSACPRYCTGPSMYKGTFNHGDLHGKGILHFMDGRVYKGEFYRSMLAGKGTMTYQDGRTVSGLFHLNKPMHPKSHVVYDAFLVGKNFSFKGDVCHGYPHGSGTRTKVTTQGKIEEIGYFHWGIFEIPLEILIKDLCYELLTEVFELYQRNATEKLKAVAENARNFEEVTKQHIVDDFDDTEVNGTEVAGDGNMSKSAVATSALFDTIDDVGDSDDIVMNSSEMEDDGVTLDSAVATSALFESIDKKMQLNTETSEILTQNATKTLLSTE
jgi:hypothetical protein